MDRKGRCSGPLAKGSRGVCGGLHDASTHLHHHGKEGGFTASQLLSSASSVKTQEERGSGEWPQH